MVKHTCLVEKWFGSQWTCALIMIQILYFTAIAQVWYHPLSFGLVTKVGKNNKKKKKKSRVTSKHPFTQTYSTQMCEIARKKALTLQSGLSHFVWTRSLKVSQRFGTMFERSTLVQIEPFFNYWNFLEQYQNKMGLQSQNNNL
jgi:hypothetical protein